MWELNCKESWAPKNWCFWTVVLEKTLESLLDNKEIQPVHPKGNQSWIFIGRWMNEWIIHGRWLSGFIRGRWMNQLHWSWSWKSNTLATWFDSWLIGKDPDAGKDWRQEKGITEDEMVGWHHPLNGHELSELWELVMDRETWSAGPRGPKESDTTKWLNWPELNWTPVIYKCKLIITYCCTECSLLLNGIAIHT